MAKEAEAAPETSDDSQYKAREYTKIEGSEKHAEQGAEKSYTIKSGDTLSDISKEQLGDANRWKEIYELNKDAIGDNPDLIHPGKKLKLPD